MADKPVTREEKYLAYLTGDYKGELPKPITRKEKYLYELCLKGMGGEISPEEIKNAVNEYLEKNPVKPGATTEQAQQIEQNKTDITSLKVKTGSLKEDLVEVKREIGGESIVLVDVSFYANPKYGSNTGFFHTDDFEIQSDATIRFSKNYGQLFAHNTLTDVETTLTDGIVIAKGSYWLQGYTMPVTQMTSESALAEVKNDINIQVVEKVDGEIWDRINEKFDGLKGKTTNFEIDLTFLADSYIPTSDKFFSY